MTVPALAPGRMDLEIYRLTSYRLMYQFTHRLGQAGCAGSVTRARTTDLPAKWRSLNT